MTTLVAPAPAAQSRSRLAGNRWLILVAMTGALSMIMLDQTVVTVALPSMTRDLPLSAGGQQWVVNAYVLAMAALVAIGGKLGDRFGQVTTFRLGVITFFLASALCGLAPHAAIGQNWLIGARALQGVGAALMMPVSAVIVMAAFDVKQRGRAMAIDVGLSQVFLAVGPLLGGVLTEQVSWRAVFWLNVPVGLFALVLVHIARPANTRLDGARVNLFTAALLVGGLGATVFAIQQASTWGWTSRTTLTTLAIGVVVTGFFVLTQLRSKNPLVAVRLFGRRGFAGDAAVMGFSQFGLLALVLFSSIYLQELLGFSPMKSGLAVLPLILPIAIGAQIAGRWYDKAGVRPPVLTGLTLTVIGTALWAASLPSLRYELQLPGMVIAGLGIGMLISPTNTDALGRATLAERAQASGLMQTVRQLGGTLGIAVIGALVLHAQGNDTARQHAADAITIGFVAAAIAFLVALLAGWRLLSAVRVTDSTN
ncbi:MAG: stp 8 [Pseudonocardiales bacterium]|nr:stp 8 [Pseudonocardiales bacterium]